MGRPNPAHLPVDPHPPASNNSNMAIGSAYNSALAGMNSASQDLLGAATSVASGNLDNLPNAMMTEQLAQIEFAAAAKLMSAQNQMVGALLDITA